jgi:hypothetical protein
MNQTGNDLSITFCIERLGPLADKLYTAYCTAVGGKAFNGDPLPKWAEFSADPNKRMQYEGWLVVANDAIATLAIPARSMRAKMEVESLLIGKQSEKVTMKPVCAKSYPADGSDEDNTFAKFSPSGSLELWIGNPALAGKLKPGDTYYLDFTPAN